MNAVFPSFLQFFSLSSYTRPRGCRDLLLLNKKLKMEKHVAREPYYHGLLPREDIKAMLKNNGDFLIRITEPHLGDRAIIISLMVRDSTPETGIKHVVIRPIGAKFHIEIRQFDSIPAMISHYLSKGEPIVAEVPDSVLKNPIGRKSWELLHEDIESTKKLGEGAYGEVHAGKLRLKSGVKVNVAIKMAKMDALTKEQIKEFMREARLMRSFDHPHIVKFYGVAAGTEPLMVLMELVDCGALDSYLTKNPTLPPEKRTEMCTQAAWGIEYLHFSKNVIHCDVAARNCLYGNGKVKISDFGLTREGTTYKVDPTARVPIRWLAPEILRTAMYSQKTDVWAFGVMCWEIFACMEPYAGMTTAEVRDQVKQGFRLTFPMGTPIDLITLVARCCWIDDPNERSSMADVAQKLENLTNLPRPQQHASNNSCEQQTAIQTSRSKKVKSKKRGKN